ncbi:MAG: COG4315 family predicted lipoprotein [Ktedonobacterales bacterium]
MRLRTYLALPVAALVLTLALAACGSGTANGGGSAPSATATATAAPTSTPLPAPTATAVPANAALITTATVTVSGTAKTILTNAQGLSLYYFTPDTASTSACTTGCIGAWPALTFSGSGAPTASSALSGKLSVATTAPGRQQVEYNGHPLYTYSGDSKPGDTSGEGLFGKWFLATPSLSAM